MLSANAHSGRFRDHTKWFADYQPIIDILLANRGSRGYLENQQGNRKKHSEKQDRDRLVGSSDEIKADFRPFNPSRSCFSRAPGVIAQAFRHTSPGQAPVVQPDIRSSFRIVAEGLQPHGEEAPSIRKDPGLLSACFPDAAGCGRRRGDLQ